MAVKNIAILGSTGSIGESALKVVCAFNGEFRIAGLTTDTNIAKLSVQVKRFKPRQVGIVNPESFRAFMDRKNGPLNGLKVHGGVDSLKKIGTAESLDPVPSGED